MGRTPPLHRRNRNGLANRLLGQLLGQPLLPIPSPAKSFIAAAKVNFRAGRPTIPSPPSPNMLGGFAIKIAR